ARRARRVRRAHRAGRARVHELRLRARRRADGAGRGGGARRASGDRGQGGAPPGDAPAPRTRGAGLRPGDQRAVRRVRGSARDARLGQQIRVGFGVAQALGDAQSLALDARVAYAHGPFDLFRAGRRVAEARVDLGAVTASLERRLGTAAALYVRLKGEHARWADAVAAVDSPAI